MKVDKDKFINKVYIDKNIFYIDDFISKDDINIIVNEINKTDKEYIDNEVHPVHSVITPRNIQDIWKDKYSPLLHKIFDNEKEYYRDGGNPVFLIYKKNNNDTASEEWAMLPHADRTNDTYVDHDGVIANVVSGFVIFITDDFVGGEIKYTNKDILFKPKSGTLLSHPGTLEYEHGVLKFEGKDRIVFTGFTYSAK